MIATGWQGIAGMSALAQHAASIIVELINDGTIPLHTSEEGHAEQAPYRR
jgi:hypothetical protein